MVRTDYFEPLARQLRSGDIDVLVGLSMTPQPDARHTRTQEVVWVNSPSTHVEPDRPVPLVSYGEACIYHRLAVRALQAAGFDWEDVFTGPSFASLRSAVSAGLGVMPVTRRRAIGSGMRVWEDTPLPRLPDLYSEIYVREGGARVIYEQLADEIATAVFMPLETADARPQVADSAA